MVQVEVIADGGVLCLADTNGNQAFPYETGDKILVKEGWVAVLVAAGLVRVVGPGTE